METDLRNGAKFDATEPKILNQIWSINYLKSNALTHVDALLGVRSILNVNIAPKNHPNMAEQLHHSVRHFGSTKFFIDRPVTLCSLGSALVRQYPLANTYYFYLFGLSLGSQ